MSQLVPLVLREDEIQPLLICAAPGTGKTWSSIQLNYLLSEELLNYHNLAELGV